MDDSILILAESVQAAPSLWKKKEKEKCVKLTCTVSTLRIISFLMNNLKQIMIVLTFNFLNLSHCQKMCILITFSNFVCLYSWNTKYDCIEARYLHLHSSHSSRRKEPRAGRSPSAQRTEPSGINRWPAAQRTERDARTPHFLAPNSLSRACGLTGSFWNVENKRANFYIWWSSTFKCVLGIYLLPFKKPAKMMLLNGWILCYEIFHRWGFLYEPSS